MNFEDYLKDLDIKELSQLAKRVADEVQPQLPATAAMIMELRHRLAVAELEVLLAVAMLPAQPATQDVQA